MIKVIDLSNDEIEALFKGTNFGGQERTNEGRRNLMVECVLKKAAGYGEGSTIRGICKEAGLLTKRGNSNKAGVRWAFHQMRRPICLVTLETLQTKETPND